LLKKHIRSVASSGKVQMVQITKRSLTAEERRKLQQLRPSFLFRDRRKVAEQELNEGVVEVLDLEILRAWDMNGCWPPCCPHSYLFQVGEREYFYAESWTAFNFPDGQFPRRRIEIVRSPLVKRVLSVNADGEVIRLEDSPCDRTTEYFSLSGDTECEILQADEMPEDVLSVLAAT
jgi:hypothetical protein